MSGAYPALTKTTTATSGTGAYVLGTANLTTAHRTPKQAVADGSLADGDIVHYLARDTTVTGDASFEEGEGVYTDATNEISRTAAGVIDGSSGPGALVSWPASGQRDIYLLGIVAALNSAGQFGSATGLTLSGSNQSGGDLQLDSTTHATKGDVVLQPTSGNVGIGGAPDATANLHVKGAGSIIPVIESTGGGATHITLKTSAANRRVIARDASGNVESQIDLRDSGEIRFFGPTADDRVVITTAADVGINTASPQARLHVLESGTAGTPAIAATTVGVFQNSTAVGTVARIAVISGNTAVAGVHLGDTDDEDRYAIVADHSAEQVQIWTGGAGTRKPVIIADAAISSSIHVDANSDIILGGSTPLMDGLTIRPRGDAGSAPSLSSFDGMSLVRSALTTSACHINVISGTNSNAGINLGDAGAVRFQMRYLNASDILSMDDAIYIDLSDNIYLGPVGTPVAGAGSPQGVVHIFNAPTIATDAPANSVCLYAKDVTASSELFVRDEAAVETQLSAHLEELPSVGWAVPDNPRTHPTPWVHHEAHEIQGFEAVVDMWTLAREVERLSGKKIVYEHRAAAAEDAAADSRPRWVRVRQNGGV